MIQCIVTNAVNILTTLLIFAYEVSPVDICTFLEQNTVFEKTIPFLTKQYFIIYVTQYLLFQIFIIKPSI